MKKILFLLVFLMPVVLIAADKVIKTRIIKKAVSEPVYEKVPRGIPTPTPYVYVEGEIVFFKIKDGSTHGESKGSKWAEEKHFSIKVPLSDAKNWLKYAKELLRPKPTPTP